MYTYNHICKFSHTCVLTLALPVNRFEFDIQENKFFVKNFYSYTYDYLLIIFDT